MYQLLGKNKNQTLELETEKNEERKLEHKADLHKTFSMVVKMATTSGQRGAKTRLKLRNELKQIVRKINKPEQKKTLKAGTETLLTR